MAQTPKRKRSDYLRYYHERCAKLAPRTIDFDHDAFEETLALLMYDHPGRSESQCVIALAKMGLMAPYTGRRAV